MTSRKRVLLFFLYVTGLFWFAGIARGAEKPLPPLHVVVIEPGEYVWGRVAYKVTRPPHQIARQVRGNFFYDWYPTSYYVLIVECRGCDEEVDQLDDDGSPIYLMVKVSKDIWDYTNENDHGSFVPAN